MAVSFLIGLGLAFGEEMASLFDPITNAPLTTASAVVTSAPAAAICAPLSLWFLFLSFPAVTVCFFIQLDAPLRRWPVMFACGAIAFWVSFALTYSPLSSGVQTVLASAAVGLFASLYGYFTVLPSR